MPNDSRDTLELLEFAVVEPEQAFGQLMERHLPYVKQLIRRRLRPQMRPRLDASDVVQETDQRAFKQFGSYLDRRPMPFRLWLLRTAHEHLIDIERHHIDAQRRSVDRELPLPDESSLAILNRLRPSPASEVTRREEAAIVRRCLAKLSSINREVLMLRCFDGLSNVEVAALLESNPETTRKRFARALLQLKQHLIDSGLSSHGGRS